MLQVNMLKIGKKKKPVNIFNMPAMYSFAGITD